MASAQASDPSRLGMVSPRSQRESVEGSTPTIAASSRTDSAACSRRRRARPFRNIRLTFEILAMSIPPGVRHVRGRAEARIRQSRGQTKAALRRGRQPPVAISLQEVAGFPWGPVAPSARRGAGHAGCLQPPTPSEGPQAQLGGRPLLGGERAGRGPFRSEHQDRSPAPGLGEDKPGATPRGPLRPPSPAGVAVTELACVWMPAHIHSIGHRRELEIRLEAVRQPPTGIRFSGS